MQFYRCKCGESTAWTSMGVSSCSRCSKCGSDFAQGRSEHAEPEAHDYVTKYDQNTGKPYEMCRRHRRDRRRSGLWAWGKPQRYLHARRRGVRRFAGLLLIVAGALCALAVFA